MVQSVIQFFFLPAFFINAVGKEFKIAFQQVESQFPRKGGLSWNWQSFN